MSIDLNGRVAIVTGAGGGLGRQYALLLASRGAQVVVNDLGGGRDGTGASSEAAQGVVDEIMAAGGTAIASGASVTDFEQVTDMVAQVQDLWGRVDIVVNNAGILRDRTFAKLDLADFRAVVDVHLMGAVHCSKAVWDIMKAQNHGRIVFTTSSSGLWGNFGQSAYAAAKLGLVGLMNTLRLEGERYGIRVNSISPSAATRMTADVLQEEYLSRLDPELVAPAVLALCADDAPNGAILCAGAGAFSTAVIAKSRGMAFDGAPDAAERILQNLEEIRDRKGDSVLMEGPQQALVESGFITLPV